MSIVSANSSSTTIFSTKGTRQNTSIEALVLQVIPDHNMKESLQNSIKKRDWMGRVIFNINVNRHDARPFIFANTDAFKFLKKRVIQEITKVIGHQFFIKVQTLEMEDGTKMNYFLKIRVSKKNEAPPSSVADESPDVPEISAQERFNKVQAEFKAANTVTRSMTVAKNPFAALVDSDDE